MTWSKDSDGNFIKVKGLPVFGRLNLPTDGAQVWKVVMTKKKGTTRKCAAIKVEFPLNTKGLIDLQLTMEVFDNNTTAAVEMNAAFVFASLEVYGEDNCNDSSGWYKSDTEHCECKLCTLQAL